MQRTYPTLSSNQGGGGGGGGPARDAGDANVMRVCTSEGVEERKVQRSTKEEQTTTTLLDLMRQRNVSW